jgi:phosphatidylinositol glycan class K
MQLLLCLLHLLTLLTLAHTTQQPPQQNHTSNWAVIVDTSRFWFNYRHAANALSVYHACKRFGIDDDHIILMLAGDVHACDSRNTFPGTVYNDHKRSVSLYDTSIQVDYRGLEVTVEAVIQVLTGRHPIGTPNSKRIRSDDGSNILFYMTGHGGEEFLKIQDTTEISTRDIQEALLEMNSKGRYNEMFFMADTCQASTLMTPLKVPRMVTIGSSKLGQSSYSYSNDYTLGVSLIDRFTFVMLNFFQKITAHTDGTTRKTLHDLFTNFDSNFLRSNPEWSVKDDQSVTLAHGGKEEQNVLQHKPITDFFGSVTQVGISNSVGFQRR